MKLAVIPARGGSKRIPGKNIKLFAGKPMIAWSIEVARESGCFDNIIVSTDDPEIAEVAKQYGAEVPFMRPAELSRDDTPTVPAIAHAVQWWSNNKVKPEFVCCIYATAPFIYAEDLQKGLAVAQGSDAPYVIPVTTFPFAIQRGVKITPGGRLEMFSPQYMQTRSQELEPAYHDAGLFYWGRAESWLGLKPFFVDAQPVILPRYRVQDIDTMEDWIRAEHLFAGIDKTKTALKAA